MEASKSGIELLEVGEVAEREVDATAQYLCSLQRAALLELGKCENAPAARLTRRVRRVRRGCESIAKPAKRLDLELRHEWESDTLLARALLRDMLDSAERAALTGRESA